MTTNPLLENRKQNRTVIMLVTHSWASRILTLASRFLRGSYLFICCSHLGGIVVFRLVYGKTCHRSREEIWTNEETSIYMLQSHFCLSLHCDPHITYTCTIAKKQLWTKSVNVHNTSYKVWWLHGSWLVHASKHVLIKNVLYCTYMHRHASWNSEEAKFSYYFPLDSNSSVIICHS